MAVADAVVPEVESLIKLSFWEVDALPKIWDNPDNDTSVCCMSCGTLVIAEFPAIVWKHRVYHIHCIYNLNQLCSCEICREHRTIVLTMQVYRTKFRFGRLSGTKISKAADDLTTSWTRIYKLAFRNHNLDELRVPTLDINDSGHGKCLVESALFGTLCMYKNINAERVAVGQQALALIELFKFGGLCVFLDIYDIDPPISEDVNSSQFQLDDSTTPIIPDLN